MKPRILITGANGLVAGHLTELLAHQPEHELFLTSKNELATTKGVTAYAEGDLTNAQFVREIIQDVKPNVLYHTAAITSVDISEKEQEKATELNVESTLHLAKWANQLRTQFVHYSTDFVFDGTGKNYCETDAANPISHYGRTKLKSEQIVQSILPKALVIRTILVYGYLPKTSRWSFPFLVINRAKDNETLNITSDQFRTPIYAPDLATGSIQLAQKGLKGIYHLGGPEYLSVYDFAQQVSGVFELPTDKLHPVTTDSLHQIGPRPLSTGFNIEKAKTAIGFTPLSVHQGLQQMKSKMAV